MDRLLYIAMTGAKETLRAQATNNHNLANASTTAFRAELTAFQTRNVTGPGHDSRAYATDSTIGFDHTPGAQQSTGRDLDVAIQGEGFLAVQAADGREAYTRAGNLRIEPSGLLTTATGHAVLGDGGPITVPPHASIAIAADGSVSIVPLGQTAATTAIVGRIKLVNPPVTGLVRGPDGLFRQKGGAPAPADAGVRLASGVLEASNVNVAEAMVRMIELSRQFDLQVKTMRAAEDNGAASAELLKL